MLKVVELHDGTAVERELALIKVRADPALRGQLLEVASVFGAIVVDMSPTTLVLEAVSSPAKLDALLAMLDNYGTCELVRTGRIALARGAGVITDDAGLRRDRLPCPTRPSLPPDDPRSQSIRISRT